MGGRSPSRRRLGRELRRCLIPWTAARPRHVPWKVAIDLSAMQDPNEHNHILFDGQANSVVANPDAVEGPAAPQFLDAGHAHQALSFLDVLYCFPDSREDRPVLQRLEVTGETLFEADFQ